MMLITYKLTLDILYIVIHLHNTKHFKHKFLFQRKHIQNIPRLYPHPISRDIYYYSSTKQTGMLYILLHSFLEM